MRFFLALNCVVLHEKPRFSLLSASLLPRVTKVKDTFQGCGIFSTEHVKENKQVISLFSKLFCWKSFELQPKQTINFKDRMVDSV